MVALAIISVVLVGVVGGYINFSRITGSSIELTTADAEAKLALRLMQRDLNMAGFGLPPITRVASHDGGKVISEETLDVDLNNDGDQEDDVATDRIFIADGWEILTDVTTNGAEDGDVQSSPDFYSLIASRREKGGYRAELVEDVSAGSTLVSAKVTTPTGDTDLTLNLNVGEECSVNDCDRETSLDTDFKSQAGMILYGKNALGEAGIEGHGISFVTPPQLEFASGESLERQYLADSSLVVPAITWYLDRKENDQVVWLYRNQHKVISNVANLQFSYGFDVDNDGLQWSDTIPPTDAGGAALAIDGETNPTRVLESLRSVRIRLTVSRSSDNFDGGKAITEYEQVVNLRN